MSSPVIISASRRTDLPAFFSEWFSGGLSAGTVEYRAPYTGRPAVLPLDRGSVAAFVFWTRDPRPFFDVLDRLERDGYPSIFQFTVTGFPRELEPSVPPLAEAVQAFRRLADRIGPRRVLWRFDPLLPGEDPEALLRRFERVCTALAGLTGRCTLSIAHPYRKSLRATRHLGGIWETTPRFRETVETIRSIGCAHGLDVRSCCSPLLADWGIAPGPCVDAELLRALWPGAEIPAAQAPSRAGCLCAASRDIGSYRTCRHGCVYCYAA